MTAAHPTAPAGSGAGRMTAAHPTAPAGSGADRMTAHLTAPERIA
ncbi:hypothetical protein [Streptomyces lichenis]|nr:hypothetical protein [Streptomyces lichenis]